MGEPTDKELTAFLISLAEENIPTDVQELLTVGNPMMNIRPGSLRRALAKAADFPDPRSKVRTP